jgi:hypothetical protein
MEITADHITKYKDRDVRRARRGLLVKSQKRRKQQLNSHREMSTFKQIAFSERSGSAVMAFDSQDRHFAARPGLQHSVLITIFNELTGESGR